MFLTRKQIKMLLLYNCTIIIITVIAAVVAFMLILHHIDNTDKVEHSTLFQFLQWENQGNVSSYI